MRRCFMLFLLLSVIGGFLESGEIEGVQGLSCLDGPDTCVELSKQHRSSPDSESHSNESCSDCHCHHGHGHSAAIALTGDHALIGSSTHKSGFPAIQQSSTRDYLNRINRPPIS